MGQLYQDAMARVRKFGKPDLFVTFTCNPKWKEITNALFPAQTAKDRLDLVTRVFNLKLDALLKDIEDGVLGNVIAKIWVIEFQKRGLPHVHILFILDEVSKLCTAEDYDSMVSTEIPDPICHPKVYETVTSCMVHGPCGPDNILGWSSFPSIRLVVHPIIHPSRRPSHHPSSLHPSKANRGGREPFLNYKTPLFQGIAHSALFIA